MDGYAKRCGAVARRTGGLHRCWKALKENAHKCGRAEWKGDAVYTIDAERIEMATRRMDNGRWGKRTGKYGWEKCRRGDEITHLCVQQRIGCCGAKQTGDVSDENAEGSVCQNQN